MFFFNNIHRRLSHVIRYNNTPKLQHENVATHSFFVALYTMVVTDSLNLPDAEKLKAIRMALVHDIEESFSGDIIYDVKRQSPEFKEAVTMMNHAILGKTLQGLPEETAKLYDELWKEYNMRDSYSAQIVEFADDLSAAMFSSEEVKLGNTYFEEILGNIKKRISNSQFYHQMGKMLNLG